MKNGNFSWYFNVHGIPFHGIICLYHITLSLSHGFYTSKHSPQYLSRTYRYNLHSHVTFLIDDVHDLYDPDMFSFSRTSCIPLIFQAMFS